MSISLKSELETWAAALKAYDNKEFDSALDLFARIADSSKILTNMGLIYATIGEHELAVEQFNAATVADPYLAVAYFQSGVSNFLIARYELALRDFEEAFLYLRGNEDINYEQIGLKFKLYSCEILFNRGLSKINMGYIDDGVTDLRDASRNKVTPEHNVIDEALRDEGRGFTVFSIPVGVVYRPSEAKLKNAKTKDYMGKARLVAAAEDKDAFTEFTGIARKRIAGGEDIPTLNRAKTTPTPKPDPINARPMAPLGRANTTINVRTMPRSPPSRVASPPTLPSTKPQAPAPSQISFADLDRNYVERADRDQRGRQQRTPPSAFSQNTLGRANTTAGAAGGGLGRSGTMSGASSTRSNSLSRGGPGANLTRKGITGGSVHRKPTTRRAASVRRPRRMEYEEEEGYMSGEHEDTELVTIRMKLHYQNDVRGMTMLPETPWEEFVERVTAKFGTALSGLAMQFKDEDGVKISLRDESDFDAAIEAARENAKGKPEGKLEIWCTDV